MGSLPSSLSTSASLISLDYSLRLAYSEHPLENEYVTDLIIYSTPLSFFSPLRHYFLLCRTVAGEQFRLEYTADEGIILTNHYVPGFRDQVYRKCKAIPGTTAFIAFDTFKKVAEHGDYKTFGHNCWHVAVDAFEELSGDTPTNLGKEIIEAFEKAAEYRDEEEQNKISESLTVKRGLLFDTIRGLLEKGHTKKFVLSSLSHIENKSIPFTQHLEESCLEKWKTPLFWLLKNKEKVELFSKYCKNFMGPQPD